MARLAGALRQRVVELDAALLLFVRRWESRAATRLMRTFTRLGDPGSWVVTGLAIGTTGGDGPRCACLLGIAAMLALVTSQVLKRACCRPRPTCRIAGFAALVECPDAFSFPSGHTTVAFAVAVALTGQGSGLGLLTLALAVGIALSRVYLGAHYPVDVAAGVVLGAGAGLLARLVVGSSHVVELVGYGSLARAVGGLAF